MADEIMKPENKAIDKPETFELPESISDFNLEDLRLSNLFICQDQSNKARDKDVSPGMLYDNMTFESFPELDVIMCFQFTTRILYGESVGDPVRCYSQDGQTPSAPTPIHSDCVNCQENILPPELAAERKSKYGECNRTINYACITPGVEAGGEKDWPFIISMQRTNMNVAKQILNLTIRKRQNLYNLIRKISTEEVVGDKGRYKIFSVTELDKTSDADIERARYWLQFIKSMQSQQKFVYNFEGEETEKNVTPSNEDEDIPFG